MRALGIFVSINFLALMFGCGSQNESDGIEDATPRLPFSQTVSNSSALTNGPLENHFVFASDVPTQQVLTFKSDLRLLDNWDGILSDSQVQNLEGILGAGNRSPSDLTLWLKSRVKYILSPNDSSYQLGLVYGQDKSVGLQNLGEAEDVGDESNTGGTNIGTAIYSTIVDEKKVRPTLSYAIILINNQWVSITSPRVGIMRIGPAYFSEQYQLNTANVRAAVNSLHRLEILFHEARHSDGNLSNGSLGFEHVKCPSDGSVALEFAGVFACDDTSNGAYTAGGVILDALTTYCMRTARCSLVEGSILQAIKLDRLSRVIRTNQTLKTLDPTPETGFNALNISEFGAFNLR